jgi:four helix bundle protein
MDQSEKKQFNEEIRERTIEMAINVREALMSVVVKSIDRPIVNQLIRSSSSVAANYRSATRGRSDAEFYSKMCIVVEESDETLFWIDYFIRIKVLKEEECKRLRDEIDQLVRLFSSIRRKMKEKIENNHQV